MILAIVGSRSLVGNREARERIRDAIRLLKPRLVISGGAVGIDKMAVEVAEHMGVETDEMLPFAKRWDGPGGFKERNEAIAERCDALVAIIDPVSKTQGARWTANYAKKIGKEIVIREVR